MIVAAGSMMNIRLVGFDGQERTVIVSLFKVSGTYQEWQQDMRSPPDCVLLNVDDENSRIWHDEQQRQPVRPPIIAIGAQALGDSIAAHITRPFRWMQILETLEIVIEQHRLALIPDRGASFISTLAVNPSVLRRGSSADWDSPPPPRVYKTIPAAMIVNPNPKGWRYITGELASRGYRVDHVCTGAAAVLLLANFRYNLIFVETQLPDEDGIGICKMLKQAQGRRRVTSIILSTNRKAVDRIRGTFAGCDAFISTPVDPDELSRTLDKLVPEYVLEAELEE